VVTGSRAKLYTAPP